MTLRVAQVNCLMDRQGRALPDLVSQWPSLAMVARAATQAGTEVHVLQSCRRAETYQADGVTYHGVPEPRRPRRGTGLAPWRLAREIRRLKPDLVKLDQEVLVETGAGVPSGFSDEEYQQKGAQIVAGRADAFAADIILQDETIFPPAR